MAKNDHDDYHITYQLEEGSEFVWFIYIVCHKNVNLEVSESWINHVRIFVTRVRLRLFIENIFQFLFFKIYVQFKLLIRRQKIQTLFRLLPLHISSSSGKFLTSLFHNNNSLMLLFCWIVDRVFYSS